MILELKQVNSFYGDIQVLRKLSLGVAAGEVLCLLGRNGVGKTTILKSIMGLVRYQGDIVVDGRSLAGLEAHQIPRHGIGYVPQGRRLFAELSVAENLDIGRMAGPADNQTYTSLLTLFPVLQERLQQQAGTLSGGEQQMLAMARALCLVPKILLLDEPTEGLMPSMIAGVRDVVLTLRDRGVGILLVEQRVEAVLPVADRVAFIENGRVSAQMNRETIERDPELLQRYVGV